MKLTHHRLKKTTIQDHSGNLESTNFHWNVLGSFITNLLENTWVFIYYLLEKWIFFFTSWLFNLKLEVITLQLAFTNWVVDVGAAHANCLATSIVLRTCAENMFWKLLYWLVRMLTRAETVLFGYVLGPPLTKEFIAFVLFLYYGMHTNHL